MAAFGVFIVRKYRSLSKVLFFLLIFTSTLRVGYIFYRFNGILLLDFFLIFLLILELRHFDGFRFRPPRIGVLFLIFIAWTIFISSSIDWMQVNSYSEISKFVRAYLILVVVYNFLMWKKDLNLFLDSLCLTMLYHSLVGFIQWRYGPVGLSFLGELQNDHYRSFGLFQHPNFLADYLVLSIPLIVRFFFYDRSRKKLLYYGGILGFALLALFTTFARGAWIGFCVALAVMFIWDIATRNFKKVKSLSLIVTVIIASLFLGKYLPTIQARLTKDIDKKNSSAQIRIPLMKVAFRMIQDRPFIGVGLTNYTLYTEDYITTEETYTISNIDQIVHNSYLLLAAEAGVPALIIYVTMLAILFFRATKTYFSKIGVFKNIAFGICCGMLAALIEFLSGPDYMIHEVLNTFWLLGGVIMACHSLDIKYNRLIAAKRRNGSRLRADRRLADAKPVQFKAD